MRNVIMTGGSGFIGSWLIRDLLKHDIHIVALVRNKYKLLPEFLKDSRVNVIECDFNNLNDVKIKEDEYDTFYHLSWEGVSPEYKNNLDIQLGNIKMSIDVMKLGKRLNCKKFIASGTVAEYVFVKDIMDVNAKQTPNDMYGAAKVATHYFLEVLSKQLNLPFIWTVIPSTFGERRRDNNIITYTIKSLLEGEKTRYGNLEQMWDFLYVSEVARALRLIGEKGISGKTYGIGSGVFKPLKEYITIIKEMINPNAVLGIGEIDNMSKQTTSSCVNIYDLICDTGFSVQVNFEEGIRRTIRYWEENGN